MACFAAIFNVVNQPEKFVTRRRISRTSCCSGNPQWTVVCNLPQHQPSCSKSHRTAQRVRTMPRRQPITNVFHDSNKCSLAYSELAITVKPKLSHILHCIRGADSADGSIAEPQCWPQDAQHCSPVQKCGNNHSKHSPAHRLHMRLSCGQSDPIFVC